MKLIKITKFAAYSLFAAAIIFSAASIGKAGKQSNLDFTIINNTGKIIHHMYCSGHDDEQWGDDVLGRDVLNDGESAEVKFSEGTEAATYDIKLEFEDKTTGVWRNFDLKTISKITATYKDGKPWAKWE
jgi:hypothetical protein